MRRSDCRLHEVAYVARMDLDHAVGDMSGVTSGPFEVFAVPEKGVPGALLISHTLNYLNYVL